MGGIIRTKTYLVNHAKGFFRILVSEHRDGTYYGGILRDEIYDRENKNKDSQIHIKQEKFTGHSESNIYIKCIDWVENNLGKEYEISCKDRV